MPRWMTSNLSEHPRAHLVDTTNHTLCGHYTAQGVAYMTSRGRDGWKGWAETSEPEDEHYICANCRRARNYTRIRDKAATEASDATGGV